MARMNRNQALGTSFRLEIPGFDEVNYFVTSVELPSISMMGVDTPYQQFGLSVPSNRIEYDAININFLVDEDFINYDKLRLWMHAIRETEPVLTQIKDCTLHVLNSNKGGVAGVKFVGCYPTMISAVPFETGVVEAMPIVCTVTMRYQFFDFVR